MILIYLPCCLLIGPEQHFTICVYLFNPSKRTEKILQNTTKISWGLRHLIMILQKCKIEHFQVPLYYKDFKSKKFDQYSGEPNFMMCSKH